MEPNSFCTISTKGCASELVSMLLSLSLHNKDAKVVCMVDSETKNIIENTTPKIQLNIDFLVELDKYSGKNRYEMEQIGIWTEFQMKKSYVLEYAINKYGDSLLLDSDMIILDKIDDIDKSKEIGLSPHYIKKSDTDLYGYYNGGMLWSRINTVPEDWREATKTSRFYDQASLENLAKKYTVFIFNESYNFSWWRLGQSDEAPHIITSYVSTDKNNIYYKNKKLKLIHTHFTTYSYCQAFNNLIIKNLILCKRYKELAIIQRIIDNGKWVIQIPKQPMSGIWHHTNDSFRELVENIEKKVTDVAVEHSPDVLNTFLKSGICIYDRDTLMWYEQNTIITMYNKGSPILYVGNCDLKEDTNTIIIKTKDIVGDKDGSSIKIKPWTYWARRPVMLEGKIDTGLGIKSYKDRQYTSIFIGNVENSVQGSHRLGKGWDNVIEYYVCTQGFTPKYTHEEYLEEIAKAKFGLSLREYGAKCHREIELMAVGTVPLVGPELCIDSYLNPPVEGVHYIRVNKPEDLSSVISSINEEQWTKMSNACKQWYKENCYSTNLWNNLISDILYT